MTPVVRHVRLRDVALEHGCWHRVTASGEEAQELVVQAGRLEVGLQRSPQLLVVEDLDHRRILVSEEELDRPVLRRLEARRLAEQVTKLDVLDGRQGLEPGHCSNICRWIALTRASRLSAGGRSSREKWGVSISVTG